MKFNVIYFCHGLYSQGHITIYKFDNIYYHFAEWIKKKKETHRYFQKGTYLAEEIENKVNARCL